MVFQVYRCHSYASDLKGTGKNIVKVGNKMIEGITAISIWELVKHARIWITNLTKAKAARKRESVDALRKVIIAARRTRVYTRQLIETKKRSHKIENELAVLWTELSFALEDIGLKKLAKKCMISGKHWADPESYDTEYLKKADIGLESMEKLASNLLKSIKR